MIIMVTMVMIIMKFIMTDSGGCGTEAEIKYLEQSTTSSSSSLKSSSSWFIIIINVTLSISVHHYMAYDLTPLLKLWPILKQEEEGGEGGQPSIMLITKSTKWPILNLILIIHIQPS